MDSSLLISQMADLRDVGRGSDARKDHVSRLQKQTHCQRQPGGSRSH